MEGLGGEDWRNRSFFNENIAREKKRLRDNIFPERSQRGQSHNGALTMKRPILVFEAMGLLYDRCVWRILRHILPRGLLAF